MFGAKRRAERKAEKGRQDAAQEERDALEIRALVAMFEVAQDLSADASYDITTLRPALLATATAHGYGPRPASGSNGNMPFKVGGPEVFDRLAAMVAENPRPIYRVGSSPASTAGPPGYVLAASNSVDEKQRTAIAGAMAHHACSAPDLENAYSLMLKRLRGHPSVLELSNRERTLCAHAAKTISSVLRAAPDDRQYLDVACRVEARMFTASPNYTTPRSSSVGNRDYDTTRRIRPLEHSTISIPTRNDPASWHAALAQVNHSGPTSRHRWQWIDGSSSPSPDGPAPWGSVQLLTSPWTSNSSYDVEKQGPDLLDLDGADFRWEARGYDQDATVRRFSLGRFATRREAMLAVETDLPERFGGFIID